jgi:hypothetical protein
MEAHGGLLASGGIDESHPNPTNDDNLTISHTM